MNVTHKLTMDLTVRKETPRLNMVQCDANSRQVELTLTADGAAWAPEAVDNVFLRYRKSDGTGGSYDTLPDGTSAWTLAENVLTVALAPQVLTAAGLVEAQAVLLREDRCIATFGFQIAVEADPSLGAVESEDYINWTLWAKLELDRLLAEARDSGEFDGITYLPAVDGEGNLSWSNDAGADNPEEVALADIVARKLAGEAFLIASGGAMTGTLDMSGNRIMGLGDPQEDSDAVSKAYVSGLLRQETLVLAAESWADSSQTVSISGVTAENVVLVGPGPDSFALYGSCGLRCSTQGTGTLTFVCDQAPEEAVTVHAVILG